ncbi:DUF6154 family protein [Bacillus horti]|uniref:Cytosolic protein n=1 Tax=Caldalkalibacillus horti TaxID=77523 RepID=A0ABT9VTW5_9BACI|nr:DUF6154 family protein [Bacillus horti]MDQ0164425.1 hypothetical protein [Bacillus horti]
MKFIDDLYELYKDQLVGDEEDAIALVLYALQDHSKDDFIKLIQEMSEEEVYQMLGNYLIEKLKDKMDKEGIGQFTPHADSKNIH